MKLIHQKNSEKVVWSEDLPHQVLKDIKFCFKTQRHWGRVD